MLLLRHEECTKFSRYAARFDWRFYYASNYIISCIKADTQYTHPRVCIYKSDDNNNQVNVGTTWVFEGI